jgi:hypothetical protein
MNILEVSFLVADLTIVFGAIVSYSRFRRLKKKVDVLQTKLDSFQDNIYQLQTYQRYDLKFELDEIKSQQEKSQVTISKLGMDLKSIEGERKVYPEPFDVSKLFKMLHNNFGDKSKNTKPTDSIKNEVVQIIKDEQKPSKKRGRPSKKEQTKLVKQEVVEDKKIKKPKADSKRVITNRELEIFFKEQTKLTYREYVIKFGEQAFKRQKQLVYKRLHYYKYVKKRTPMIDWLPKNK